MQLSHASPTDYGRGPQISLTGVAIVAGLHVAVAALLVTLDVVHLPPQMATLMVHVIQPEPPKPQEITPPAPKPVVRQPTPQAKPESLPQPQVMAANTPAPSAAGEAPVVMEAPVLPAQAPPTVSAPRFDADYLDNPAPVYPALSRRMEESGKTVLRVYVEPGGKPSQIQINSSSGSPRLDQAAQDAVWRWKFIPARRGDETIGAWVLVPIEFNLKG